MSVESRFIAEFPRQQRFRRPTLRVGTGLWTAMVVSQQAEVAVQGPVPTLKLFSNFRFTPLSLDLLHGSKDSTHLDFGFEFDRHPVCIIGEPNQKTPTALKQPSKD